jgi:hypothetical protein
MITLKDLIVRFNILGIKHRLVELYPEEEEILDEYEKVYNKLCEMESIQSQYKIHIRPRVEEKHEWISVSGYLVTDENPEGTWAIDFTDWNEWLGMEIEQETLENFTALDIICHCLFEMTVYSFDEDEITNQAKYLKEVVEFIEKDLLLKKDKP